MPAILIAGMIVHSGWAADWPHYLDPNYDLKPAVTEFTASSATEQWNAQVNTGMCSITVSDGLLFTMVMLSEKGELIWGKLGQAYFQETHRQKVLDGLCWSKPVLLENLLYARNAEGQMVCLKLQ